ncbi:MAG TPA: DUF2071 domain-containing protein [Planctomycetaceae bacterium]|mgnify:CR=1 FL=1|nr:DUF2071 domain-containing protein [Planctomycetaceae bacterium]HQZ64087.1 DUF2071 domain-containing protein [Planctomycetaceae bacterium]
MRLPVIRGLIDRRVLVNFRVDFGVLSSILPPPFRPQIIKGFGIAGICLIRLRHVRPRFLPSWVGISSENAAHRIAVEWDVGGETRTGVFIPRRDTSSRLNAIAGGRIFPGVHRLARFDVRETDHEIHISMRSLDGSAHVLVDAQLTQKIPAESIFESVDEVSKFFESGALGYSPSSSRGQFDGLELRTFNWHVEPLKVSQIQSSFFDDRSVFPPGSVAFDNALLMRGIDHEWHGRESLCCDAGHSRRRSDGCTVSPSLRRRDFHRW